VVCLYKSSQYYTILGPIVYPWRAVGHADAYLGVGKVTVFILEKVEAEYYGGHVFSVHSTREGAETALAKLVSAAGISGQIFEPWEFEINDYEIEE
jgi:hypothetical protein